MRVNPDLNLGMLTALERITQTQNSALDQLASGTKIQKPSDDPAGFAALVQLQASDSAVGQYLRSLESVRSQTQAADSSLSSVITCLEKALTLGVRGATGTLSESDRQAIAAEIDGIGDQVLELANTSIQGFYLFSGTASTTKPFSAVQESVTYKGSNISNQVAIGEGRVLRINVPGMEIFGVGSESVFAALQSVSYAVREGMGVTESLDALRQARDGVAGARVEYGNSLSQIDNAALTLKERQLMIAQQETELAGADLAEVATRLASAGTSRNALLAAIAKTNQSNLFDYIR